MKRIVLVALLLLGLTLPASASAKKYTKFCGHSPSGIFTLAAGKKPYPETSCNFARAAMKQFAFKVAAKGDIPSNFKLKVNGKRLNGAHAIWGPIELITMQNKKHYVLMLAPH